MISDFPRRPPPNDPRDLRLPDRRVLIMSANYATMNPIMRPNHGECGHVITSRFRNGRPRARRHPAYDRNVRHNPSTVVVLAGQPGDGLLTAVGRPANVTLVRPEATASPGSVAGTPGDGIAVAAAALRRAARISSPYVLVAADPLAAV